MSLNNPVLGEGYVPAYQISPVPFVTASNVTLGQTRGYNFEFVGRRPFSVKETAITFVDAAVF